MVIDIYEFGRLTEHYNAPNDLPIKQYKIKDKHVTFTIHQRHYNYIVDDTKHILVRHYSVIDLHTKRIYKTNNHKDALELIKIFVEKCDAPNSNPNRYRIIVKEERI